MNRRLLPRRRFFRFSLATLVLVLTGFSLWFGWLADRAHRQKLAVQAIRELGGTVYYDWEVDAEGRRLDGRRGIPLATPPGPAWLRTRIGEDFFADVVQVQLGYLRGRRETSSREIRDDDLRHLRGLPRLRRLSLWRTKISDVGLARLAHLSELEYLNLEETSVTGTGLAHLRCAKNLRTLRMPDCPIDDKGLVHLANFPELEHLALWRTPVSNAAMTYIASLRNLQELQLEETNVTGAAIPSIARLRELKSLKLWNARIDNAGAASLRQMTHLRMLDLSVASIRNECVAALAQLPAAEEIVLDGSNLTDAGAESLVRGLGKNRRVHLSLYMTYITDETVERLRRESPNIGISYDEQHLDFGNNAKHNDKRFRQQVDARRSPRLPPYYVERVTRIPLANTSITDASLELLDVFPNLKQVDLRGAKVTPAGVAKLRSARPDLAVYLDGAQESE